MAKQKKSEGKKIEFWRGRWVLPEDFPEENVSVLSDRFDVAEKWEAKRRMQGPPFNEQFCADVYAIAFIMTKDNSFSGKFNPELLYQEMCDTMKEMRKGKKEYSLFDEANMLGKVMDKHKKKVSPKK